MKNIVIGIRREDRNVWERRAPLSPFHVAILVQDRGYRVLVQPSDIRYFRESEYLAAGAEITDDLSPASIIAAVKEIPPDRIIPGKAYLFFSHTIKGQPYNMPMLKVLMDKGCTLIDYEKIHDDKNRRLVFFGRYAGLAGMIDSFWALGRRLEAQGYYTPFREIALTHEYRNLAEARQAVAAAGEIIQQCGLPPELSPLVFGFSGYGHVSGGAQEIFDLLPHRQVQPGDLAAAVEESSSDTGTIKVVFRERDMVERRSDGGFELQEYYDSPQLYRSVFHRYLPDLTVLINGVYWDTRYPRLITREQFRQLYRDGQTPKLQVIGDISCDVDGAVQCTVRSTTLDDPVYTYDPVTGTTLDGVGGRGPVVLAVDNLPCELPREASNYFGTILLEFIIPLAKADYTVPFDDFAVSPVLKRAVIVYDGELTPRYRYLQRYVQAAG